MANTEITTQNDLDNGDISFVQHFFPGMQDGDYELTLTHTFSDTGSKDPKDPDKFSETYTLYVQGPRIQLPPTDIAAQFPPPGNQGDYDNVLPHIVFNDKYLPWQRRLDYNNPLPDPRDKLMTDYPSWLALLVFSGDEAPQTQTGTLADVMPSGFLGLGKGDLPSKTLSYDDFKLESSEATTDPIYFIDVDIATFNKIAPSSEDLKLLAHSRIVSMEKKSDKLLSGEPTGSYSVLVGNRRGIAGQTTTVHLVNLENMAQYLPADDTYAPSDKTSGYDNIRLISLASWSYTPLQYKQTFADYIAYLNEESGAAAPGVDGSMRLPDPQNSNVSADLKNALQLGYVPMAHQTRNGESTVSWYRGPLAPFAVTTETKSSFPRFNADSNLRYNPNSGMFDVSYAAAWQLGRNLALSNKAYSEAL
ncbi:MAG: hypothetical protein AAF570_12245, partial [Bacteroidota bacterium]